MRLSTSKSSRSTPFNPDAVAAKITRQTISSYRQSIRSFGIFALVVTLFVLGVFGTFPRKQYVIEYIGLASMVARVFPIREGVGATS